MKHYVTRQEEWANKVQLKQGDEVKIISEHKGNENGWGNSWTESMTRSVGSIGEVTSGYFSSSGGIDVRIRSKSCWLSFPYFALEKVDKSYLKTEEKEEHIKPENWFLLD